MRDEILNFLFTDLSNINGIGSKKAKIYERLLSKKDIEYTTSSCKMLDLLTYIPERIITRKIVKGIEAIEANSTIIAKVRVVSHNPPSRSKQPYTVTCYLGQNFITIVFYKYYENYINLKLKVDSDVFVSGKTEVFNNQIQIVHPDYITNELKDIPIFEPIYCLTNGLSNKDLIKNLDFILKNTPDLPEWLDDNLLTKTKWIGWKDSLINIHKPTEDFDVKNSKYVRRLAFDELLAEQLTFAFEKKINSSRNKKTILENRDRKLKNKFINEILKFKLTEDQIAALTAIENDTFSDKKMSRLLQGDVGSGKTIVSLISMLNYIENGQQCVLMVPTSILAQQHFENISNFCKDLDINVGLLSGKIKGKKRDSIVADIKNGKINILIGTHALIEENIEFQKLGFVVIDEQHRFGVEQRLILIGKNPEADVLAMSATPIPRTLALTLYNQMDLTIIAGRPVDRKNIITTMINTKDKYIDLLNRIKERIELGEKIYWICPLVEENENIDLTDVNNKFREFCDFFGEANVAVIHGKMKEKEKDAIMEDFCSENGKKILVSTTLVEVGIDVKEATIIVIEHPERFGLSQLHQLRGRVGRGEKQSYCVLLYNSENCSKNTLRRLNIIRSTTNGFQIAEQDLKIRGIGEVMGLRQSGRQQYKIADLDRDFDLLELAVNYTQKVMKSNNNLDRYKLLLDLFGYSNFIDRGLLN